ncbi:MAG: hypothetical protein PHW18_07215 [Sulfuricurvum sp.]|uniref:hypothetical protein n=1 Tax=Sulfuricurvum sp. TaxID=2025608 RepID=UPI00262BB46C|nr:hypothetical protein [Sulfuricurvum sp.]MDD2829344.1 hypothetical protein [Sulfuricurvum sp.]MDD4949164.1 hypothetical protein [Sulfuricurvum sp.]
MKSYGLKIIVTLTILLSALSLYAGEPKGYKIVLASFGSFDEAKGALNKIGEKLGDEEKGLQAKEKFEIVARPSGKAYILAIEPIESESGSKNVLKQFKKFYSGAYVNGYFGPTPGSVSLASERKSDVVEENTTQETPIVTPVIENNITEKVAIPKASEIVSITEEEKPKNFRPIIYMIILLIAIGGSIFYLRKRLFSQVASSEESKSLESLKEVDSELMVEEDDNRISEDNSLPHVEALGGTNKDIFYTFKKNMFFITLLNELQSAAQRKELGRCNEIMDEILRYQKNFQKSAIMASMKDLLDAKELEKLAVFIGSEIE